MSLSPRTKEFFSTHQDDRQCRSQSPGRCGRWIHESDGTDCNESIRLGLDVKKSEKFRILMYFSMFFSNVMNVMSCFFDVMNVMSCFLMS